MRILRIRIPTLQKKEHLPRVADLGSIGPVDPGLGSGSRRAKMTHKSSKIFKSSCFEVLDGLS
jgi:hypothetical protein